MVGLGARVDTTRGGGVAGAGDVRGTRDTSTLAEPVILGGAGGIGTAVVLIGALVVVVVVVVVLVVLLVVVGGGLVVLLVLVVLRVVVVGGAGLVVVGASRGARVVNTLSAGRESTSFPASHVSSVK